MDTYNDLTRKLGIEYPIVQGPFGGGLSTARLAATVSNFGGLGSYGAHVLAPEEIEDLGVELRSLTDKPFALNLWVSDRDKKMDAIDSDSFSTVYQSYRGLFERMGATEPDFLGSDQSVYERQVEAVLRVRPKVFSFVFGIPTREILIEMRAREIITIGAATTLAEAQALEESGVDVVLATGMDAGGHRPSFLERAEDSLVGTMALVPTVRDRVGIPVIAAGGIADARGVRAALALGADAVQIGTAFLACEESGAAAAHREILLANRLGNTVLSKAFTGRLARFLPNRILGDLLGIGAEVLPFPAQSWLTRPLKQAAANREDAEGMALYAGQGVPMLRHRSAESLMRELIRAC